MTTPLQNTHIIPHKNKALEDVKEKRSDGKVRTQLVFALDLNCIDAADAAHIGGDFNVRRLEATTQVEILERHTGFQQERLDGGTSTEIDGTQVAMP